MTPENTLNWPDAGVAVHHGDCLDVLRTLPDASVDSVVTDPPYGLEFMGKEWDSFTDRDATKTQTDTWGKATTAIPGSAYASTLPRFTGKQGASLKPFQDWCEAWAVECLRVLKPGGHLLAFGGTRTFHRLACAVEDAGFEIRDSIGYGSGVIAWCYGSGFPKSRNVSNDPSVCQCLPGVRTAATDDAAESAAEVLLADLRRAGETNLANLEDLHGVPVGLHPDFEVSSRAESDVFAPVRGESGGFGERGEAVAERPARDNPVRDVWSAGQAIPEQDREERTGVLLPAVRGKSQGGDAVGSRLRRDREAGSPTVRPGQPGMEGGGDVQTAEGELHRPSVRPLPTGVAEHGTGGRLHHGAPARNGSVDRSDAAEVGGREPHQPEPTGQPSGESGVVPEQRGSQARRGWPLCGGCGKPAIPKGLGTALKPAWEPVVVARKPLAGTVAQTVLAWGTGALNVDGCRIGSQERPVMVRTGTRVAASSMSGESTGATSSGETTTAGRWPANVVLDESQADALDQMSGERPGMATQRDLKETPSAYFGADKHPGVREGFNDTGGASRFFYTAKAGKRERPVVDGTAHPTVKPLALMRWLVRLVTPPGGTVLEPFAGSGTTVEACILEGFRCIAVEREAEYLPLIAQRVNRRRDPVAYARAAGEDLGLFDVTA